MTDKQEKNGLTRRGFVASLGSTGLLGVSGCSTEEDMQTSAQQPESSTPTEAPRSFRHPGLLHTEEDFERMRTKVAAQAEPWISGWQALTSNGRSQLNASPRPLATVVRGGTGQNFAQLYIDVARSYQLALRWKVSGDTNYADRAVSYLNAWSSTLTEITGNADRYLAAGIYGWEFANAAEIMRTYPGWAPADLARFQKMMLEVFYPLSSRFLREHNGADITNYWANWDQCAIACILAVGVLCDREDLYKEALDYYYKGAGNGAGLQAVYHVHPGNLGQWQESGRDQGHATLGIGLGVALCEMAWNQGDDLYGYDNNRFLAGAEYVARSNWTDADGALLDMPYLNNANKHGVSTGVSPAGRPFGRSIWETVLHHYEGRSGVAAPYVRRQAEKLRPEWDGGNGDQLGFGTLTFAREPLTNGRPSGLSAYRSGDAVVLSWWGVPGAQSYEVQRSTRRGGPYTTVATGIADVLTFTDHPTAGEGTAYYVVRAATAQGQSAVSDEASVSLAPRLLYHVSEGTSTAAASTEGKQSVTSTTERPLVFEGNGRSIALPEGLTSRVHDFTVTAWVLMEEARTNAWLFGVESGTRRWMYLMLSDRGGKPNFGISTVHNYNTQRVVGNVAVPVGAWVHVAVTLRAGVGTLYLNGQSIGSQPDMTLAPLHLGHGASAWIARSPFSADPAFKGKLKDFRVYEAALDAEAISALAVA
jgi:hypothetical protein